MTAYMLSLYFAILVVRYFVLNDSEQIFATKYRLVLPSEEELHLEIERERSAIEDARRLEAEK